jgi:DnaJ-class molecular chaperone
MAQEANMNCRECGKPFWNAWKAIPGWRVKSVMPLFEVVCQECYEKIKKELDRKHPVKEVKVTCDSCHGTGKVKGYECVDCNGKGEKTF